MKAFLPLLLLGSFCAFAISSDEVARQLKQDIQQAEERLTAVHSAIRKETSDLEGAQAKLQKALSVLPEKIEQGNGRESSLQEQLNAVEQELEELQGILSRCQSIPKAELTLRPCRETGTALSQDGKELQGTFLHIGPASFFRTEDGSCMGPAAQRLGSPIPTVLLPLSATEASQLSLLFQGKLATPPVDLAMGAGLALREQSETLVQHFAKGGPVMIPILLLGLISTLLALSKLFQLLRLPGPRSLPAIRGIADDLGAQKPDDASRKATALKQPLRALALCAIQNRALSREVLEEQLYNRTQDGIARISRFLSVLSVTATVAPLLGLLGTVTGMIHTFKLITLFGTGDARLLSSGIAEALITTEAGLMVAIPALLIHAWCTRRVKRMGGLCREAAILFLDNSASPEK